MRRSVIVPAVLAGLTSAALVQSARADVVDLQIVDQGVSVDRAAGSASFSLTFNRTPDFVAIDHDQPDTFQYEIDADTTDLSASFGVKQIDSVIRGGEIWEGKGLPIRETTGEGGPDAGGWGPVKTLLPFELDGTTVTFTVPLDELGDADGRFRYRAFATENGAITTQVTGAIVPLPAAVLPGLLMLGGVSVVRKMRAVRKI